MARRHLAQNGRRTDTQGPPQKSPQSDTLCSAADGGATMTKPSIQLRSLGLGEEELSWCAIITWDEHGELAVGATQAEAVAKLIETKRVSQEPALFYHLEMLGTASRTGPLYGPTARVKEAGLGHARGRDVVGCLHAGGASADGLLLLQVLIGEVHHIPVVHADVQLSVRMSRMPC